MNSPTLRILTFNIKHGATLHDNFDLDRIARIIRDAEPDLVALQEVDVRTERARGLDIGTELARRTGMMPAFGRAMRFDGGEYGVAILSRHSFESTRRLPLPSTAANEPRAAIEAILTCAPGEHLRFVSTHLDFASESDRLEQARALSRILENDTMPTILAGDFNAIPGSDTMRELETHWTVACGDNPLPTFPSDAPRIKIDYVLFRPAGYWVVEETRVIQDPVASDHCACLVVLAPPGK